jgi:hypothetical protein
MDTSGPFGEQRGTTKNTNYTKKRGGKGANLTQRHGGTEGMGTGNEREETEGAEEGKERR